MVINTVATLALYCPRCGKLQMHDFSRFQMKQAAQQSLYCTCGQEQAKLTSVGSRQCLLDIPCVVCQTNHIICLDYHQLWQSGLEKIYCVQENFELGFSGSRQAIEDTIDIHLGEFKKIVSDMEQNEYDEYIENPQVMFEVLNIIHDIAEKGEVYCRCGSQAIGAEVLPDGIELECAQCGGRQVIAAKSAKDLAQVEALTRIEIVPPRRSRRKH